MIDTDVAGSYRSSIYGEGLEDSGIFDREGAGTIPESHRVLRKIVAADTVATPLFINGESVGTFDQFIRTITVGTNIPVVEGSICEIAGAVGHDDSTLEADTEVLFSIILAKNS